jgi:hypothetical protein
MSVRKKFGLLMLLLLAISACSELPQYKSNWPASVMQGGQGADYWLAELHATRGMTADQQRQALQSREQEFHDNPDSSNRLRVALLLATGDEEIRDQRRALALVEGIDPASYDASDQEMIIVFRQFLTEQRQANRKIHILWKQLDDQGRRIEELEQQLQALMTIEQKIQQRESPAAGKAGGYRK